AVSYLPFIVIGRIGAGLVAATIFHDVMWGWLFAAYFTYANDLVPADRRVEGIAVFGVAGMLTNGLGPALGEEILRHAPYGVFFTVAVGFALVSVAVTTLVPRHAAPHAHAPAAAAGRRDETWRIVRHGGVGRVLAATMLLGIGINAAFIFVAPFTRELAINRAAPFFAAYSGTSIVLRL